MTTSTATSTHVPVADRLITDDFATTKPDLWRELFQGMPFVETQSTVPDNNQEIIDEWPGNSTRQLSYPRELTRQIETLFNVATSEYFEDGMEGNFSKALVLMIKVHGTSALNVIARLVSYGQVGAEVAAEALRRIGNMNHPPTYHTRLMMLGRSLQAKSAFIRDGAALGLASLDDPAAIPWVKQAVEREKIKELREDLLLVLDQLENTRLCLTSSG